jgi:hypothetical protein
MRREIRPVIRSKPEIKRPTDSQLQANKGPQNIHRLASGKVPFPLKAMPEK